MEDRATINHIDLPANLAVVASKYNTRNYHDKLTAADRQVLNEVNLYPFCF